MNANVPVYFPFTFLEPERVESLYSKVGIFRTFRVFEKSVSEEIVKKEGDGKVISELFRLSSPDSVSIARKFLDWSSGRDMLDIKALSAFFSHIGHDEDKGNIISSIINPEPGSEEDAGLSRFLQRHEIALFLFQLKDRQDYEIASALNRISNSHQKLFFELDADNGPVPDSGSSSFGDFRLKNMDARVASWFAAFAMLSEPGKLIITDEKDGFFSFLDLFRDDEIRVFKAGKREVDFTADDFLKLACCFTEGRDVDPALSRCIETGKPSIIEDGDLFFAILNNGGIKKALSKVLGIRSESEVNIIPASYGKLILCMFA